MTKSKLKISDSLNKVTLNDLDTIFLIEDHMVKEVKKVNFWQFLAIAFIRRTYLCLIYMKGVKSNLQNFHIGENLIWRLLFYIPSPRRFLCWMREDEIVVGVWATNTKFHFGFDCRFRFRRLSKTWNLKKRLKDLYLLLHK